MGIIGSWEEYVTIPLYLYNNGTWLGVSAAGTTGMLGITGTMTLTPHIV